MYQIFYSPILKYLKFIKFIINKFIITKLYNMGSSPGDVSEEPVI